MKGVLSFLLIYRELDDDLNWLTEEGLNLGIEKPQRIIITDHTRRWIIEDHTRS